MQPPALSVRIVSAVGRQLQKLVLDGCQVDDAVLGAVGAACADLRDISLVGCRGVTDAGLAAVADGCRRLQAVAVGGGSLAAPGWREAVGLAAFSGQCLGLG